jgi:hypothetical protein
VNSGKRRGCQVRLVVANVWLFKNKAAQSASVSISARSRAGCGS